MSLSLYLSVWPSHAVRCARMASTRSKVVAEGLASSACVRLVMVARHFAHQPLIFLWVAGSQDSRELNEVGLKLHASIFERPGGKV